jgi:alpha-glucosidase
LIAIARAFRIASRMKNLTAKNGAVIRLATLALAASGFAWADEKTGVSSPDGRLAVEFHLDEHGAPRYSVTLDDKPVLRESRLGLLREDADFSKGLKFLSASKAELVKDRYEILTAKRRINTCLAMRRVYHLLSATDDKLDIVFQVSNDGVAFRYVFPEKDATVRKLKEETTTFHFLPDTRAWIQPMSKAKTGWAETNPSYEEYYEKDIPAGTPSPTGAGWVYPALFRSGGTWILLSESGLGRNHCATRLRNEAPDGEYAVGYPDPREGCFGGPVFPESTLPWATPWRVIVCGSLKTVTESMLGVDLADAPAKPAGPEVVPGKASWSWPLLKDDQTTYDVQKRFIDYAADMSWRYCLIDALWDTQIGYDKVKDLCKYAATKGVKILVWYNSGGDWNKAPQTPHSRLLTHESRMKEFNRLKDMGVAGLKIDFFGGDGQSMIAYYHDLLEDAEPFGFLMNFHGATLPRGWQRTYPHLMTAEAIRGLEFMTFEQANADKGPGHMAMLPFTRNVFDPMDFTPMVLDNIPRIQRRTTSAFELATSVLFVSGIQHYGEIPEGMAKVPDDVKSFLKTVPSIWDDSKFIDGMPGEFVVMARKSKSKWYIAGIHAGDQPKTLVLDLKELGKLTKGTLITDGDGGNLSFRTEEISVGTDGKLTVTLKPKGGFVLVF